ncbi:MAG: DUF1998 domain-containing protein [Oscillospiraceae bacterium]|nr:DUF1998 domain-containing protein [Oscillospiraceae bacterium]
MPRPSFRAKNNGSSDEKINIYSNEKYFVGSIRKTQLITTYGVGSVVDFKDDTVIIASTDSWDYDPNNPEEVESRKIFNENLSVLTGKKYFLQPKTINKSNSFSKGKTIQSYIFPEKLYCSRCGRIYDIHELDIKKRHKCPSLNCNNNLVASRFVVVCQNGHIDDFPYSWWVHHGEPCSGGKKSPRIKMRNLYNRNDIASLILECEDCKKTRSMQTVFSDVSLANYPCTCNYPHFKDPKAKAGIGCKERMKVRLRTQSGVYYSNTRSALLIPPWSKKVVQCIQKNFDILQHLPKETICQAIRDKIGDSQLTDEEILRSWDSASELILHRSKRSEFNVMSDEYAVLSSKQDNNYDNFTSYSAEIPEKYKKYFDHVAVIGKLTVTQAFVGFSRLSRTAHSVEISQYRKDWYPAVELTGEGIFIRFNSELAAQWLLSAGKRYKRMSDRLAELNFIDSNFSPLYVLLHSFAHLFIREISNVCGYSSASIKEKIYSHIDAESNEIKMCGVLIYVSSTDSDSSLGGLISVADNPDTMSAILDSMINRARWCSGDPLCISSMQQGYQSLNYAACHDCMLLPETSCEHFNVFLDRASIIGLPAKDEIGFFNL